MSTQPPTITKPPVAAATIEHDALPAGTRFGEFEILRVLGVGGFGIVYLARDHSLERDVALKEYMPASLAARGAGPQITVRSNSFAETYAIGLRSFINEARLLARFDHPSLVKVYRFWEDNATAYMVMPYLQGITLRDMRRRMAHPPDEAWIKSVVMPILSALELLHREGVYHRDIAPDNILLPPDGPPVLLDFGAARRVISDRTQSLTAILKPSYAPIEQYAEMTQLRQGPWTDLYALGAVIHYLLFGAPPAPATARAVQDDADAIESRVVAGVSPRFMEAMSWMLALRPNGRPQSGEQLRAVLDGHAEIPPRGRSGITIPTHLVPPGSAPVDPGTDQTRVSTAYMPTFMPTAHVAPAGSAKTAVDPAFAPTAFSPTTFSPKTQMPTARRAPIDPAAAAAATGSAPAPVTATVPMAPPGQATTIPDATSAVLSTQAIAARPGASSAAPAAGVVQSPAVAAGASAGMPFAAVSQPAPATFETSRPPSSLPTAQPARSRAWLAALAAGGVGIVAVAFAGWQYSARTEGAAAVAPVSAPAVTPAAAPPSADARPGTPAATGVDPGVTGGAVVAVPRPAPIVVEPQAALVPAYGSTPVPAQPVARTPAPPSPSAAVAAGMAASLLGGTTSPRTIPSADDGSLRPTTTPRSGTEIYLDRGASPDGSRLRPGTRPIGIDDRSAPTAPLRPVDRAAIAVNPGLGDGRAARPGASARDLLGSSRAEIVEDRGPVSAREACGQRGFISMAVCMDERCELPRYRTTAECVPILARKAERANR